MSSESVAEQQRGILGAIERVGNRLPDPVFLFGYLIIGLIAISVISAWLGVSAAHPVLRDESGAPTLVYAASLLAAENVARLWVDMPKTFTHFHPLGYVLLVMLGAGVAERSGFFAAGIRAAVRRAPETGRRPSGRHMLSASVRRRSGSRRRRRRSTRTRRAPGRARS